MNRTNLIKLIEQLCNQYIDAAYDGNERVEMYTRGKASGIYLTQQTCNLPEVWERAKHYSYLMHPKDANLVTLFFQAAEREA